MTLPLVFLLSVPVVGSVEFPLNGCAGIEWPALAGDEPVSSRINEELDYQLINGETISETLDNYREHGRGISRTSFTVNWMNDLYLDLTISTEFLGAYPSWTGHHFLFNLETGEKVMVEDVFLPEGLAELVSMCDEELQENIAENEIRLGEDPYPDREDRFTEDDLGSLGFREEGVVFTYGFNYPHVALALEPSGMIFFTWEEVEELLQPSFTITL